MTEKEKVEYGNPITVRSLTITLIFLVFAMALAPFGQLFRSRSMVAPIGVPFILIPLLNAMLGKISPRLKLNIHEMVLVVWCYFFSLNLAEGGAGGSFTWILEETFPSTGYVLADPALGPTIKNFVPSYMFPKSDKAISAFYYGLKTGETFPWGEFIAPIAYWSIYLFLMLMFSVSLSFTLWGKRWVEVENLPFPSTVPYLYSIQASVDDDKETGKNRWLSLRVSEYKIFWIAFLVGLVVSLWPILVQFFPAQVPEIEGLVYGEISVLLPLASVIPGAHSRLVVMPDILAIYLLLPIQTLASMVLTWFVVEVVYYAVAVQVGIIPYTPGMEYDYVPAALSSYPFPFATVWQGVCIGLGIITLWFLRGRFKEMFYSLRGQDRVEMGLSLKFATTFLIVVTLALICFFTASGVPFIISLIMVGLAVISYTYLGRIVALISGGGIDFFDQGGQNWWWATGAALGYWPNPPDISTQTQAAFATASVGFSFNYCWNLRSGSIGPLGGVRIYKIAHETKTNLKYLLVGVILMAIIGIPIVIVSYTFFLSHGGGVPRTGSWGSWMGSYKYSAGFTSSHTGIVGETKFEVDLPWQVLGMFIMFILTAMRMRFTWFWIDPTGVAYTLPYASWTVGPALFALIIKIILTRVVGATRYRQYAQPLATGVLMGFGSTMILAWLMELTTVMIPTFQSYYVPG